MRIPFLILVVSLLMTPVSHAAPDNWKEHQVAGIVFAAPDAAEVTTQALREHVTLVAITHLDEVILLTLYRGKDAPPAKRALATHGEEFERRVSKTGTIRLGRDKTHFLGRKRKVRTISHGPVDRRERTNLVAMRLTKTTVVAAWTVPKGLRQSVSATLLKGVKFE